MAFIRPEIFRPPSEMMSYFLPLTNGCSNSTCTFCSYYGSKLQLREIDEVKREIEAVAMYTSSGTCLPDVSPVVYALSRGWDGRRVFLQDGDALVYPLAKLREALHYLNEKVPGIQRVAAYATPQDILRRSVPELKELQELKLGILYMGIESGDDVILESIGKGVNHQQIVAAGRKAKQAGIILSVTVILGLGGVDGSEKHALETAKALTRIDPEYAGALTLTLVPGTPLYQQRQQGDFTLISPLESLRELKIIVENSTFTNCFFSSMHASNYLSIRGTLPEDKARMIAELDHVLTSKDPDLLRPEILRGL
jgi:radical SAM superfamily enzyme YgiQ (UPF0313 family)